MVHGDSKKFQKRTTFNKVFLEKGYHIANNPPNDRYKIGLTSIVEIIFDKKPSFAANTNARTANIADKGVAISEPNQKLVNELITQIKIQKFQKCKVYASFMDIILGAHIFYHLKFCLFSFQN